MCVYVWHTNTSCVFVWGNKLERESGGRNKSYTNITFTIFVFHIRRSIVATSESDQ